ncbi:MAG: alkaline phosphatase, partial [Candidatus Ornithomonoglobus sp.]
TAYATGYKTNEGYIGLLPAVSDMPGAVPVTESNFQMPIATVLEAAHLAGKSTGLVVTSPIMHATPASFSAHTDSRTLYSKIAKQQIYSGIDVMLGGGSFYLRDGRDDGRNLISDAEKLGFTYVTDRNALLGTTANKVLGTFASLDMNYDFDRSESEPTLEEMTVKAIELLNRNENGFFLLVEGSKIDYASHAHDPVGVVSESMSYDKAFRAAVEFAKSDGNTIVISCADHGNGGMSIGVGQSGYAQTNISSYLDPLKRASRTGAGLYSEFDSSRSNVREVVAQYYGITDLTDEEVRKIESTNEVMAAVGAMMSKRANIGWIANGHTGEDVPLSIYAPEGYGLHGIVDNTDISHLMQTFLGVDNNAVTSDLFIPVRDLFSATGANISYEIISQSRAVLVIERDGITMRLPVDTSIAIVNDSVYRLGGVTVVSNGTTYVCRDVLDLFTKVTSEAAK